MSLDAALDRLIHVRSCRRAFLAGEDAALDCSPEHAVELRSIDGKVLEELALSVAADLFSQKHAGSGGLLDLFPQTVESFRRRHGLKDALLDLACVFMESPAFDSYREIPFTGPGVCLEESFYRFAEACDLGDPVVREMEFLAAMAKLFCASPRADITLPSEVQRTEHGYYSVSSRGFPTLYGALRGRFVTGRLTPFLAALLEPGADFAQMAEQHGVSAPVLAESLCRLSDLGIL
jgi:hypothetical protein